eukprot:CAMPEP_0179252884 /NCGR_PEP_ID=MMETSP0797-20121207/22441_1 /TAXON_ID=47934 /ORGANISM="Dinophysis acuminata, Strain DAEP01" /LENGTH=33 /DNA_ID= /DNA_START= /DNA_END= /DNA_ORIENTATION=
MIYHVNSQQYRQFLSEKAQRKMAAAAKDKGDAG